MSKGVKQGEKYIVKSNNHILGEMIFLNYQYAGNQKYVTFDCLYRSKVWLNNSNVSIFRYITKDEYITKVKEKYDATCLAIILKRLIDESFEW